MGIHLSVGGRSKTLQPCLKISAVAHGSLPIHAVLGTYDSALGNALSFSSQDHHHTTWHLRGCQTRRECHAFSDRGQTKTSPRNNLVPLHKGEKMGFLPG